MWEGQAASHRKLPGGHKPGPQRIKVLERILEANAALGHGANDGSQDVVGARVGEGPPLLLLIGRAVGNRAVGRGFVPCVRRRPRRPRNGEEGWVLAVVVEGAVVAVGVSVPVRVRDSVARGEDLALAVRQAGPIEAA